MADFPNVPGWLQGPATPLMRCIPSRRNENAFAFLGDSRLDQQASAGRLTRTWHHFFNAANRIMGQCMRPVLNLAVSGSKLTVNLTQSNIDAAIASGAKYVVLFGVINDMVALQTAAQCWNGYSDVSGTTPGMKNALDQFQAAGMTAVVITEPASTTVAGNAAVMGEIANWNRYLCTYAVGNPNIKLLDFAKINRDPTSANAAFKAGHSTDGTHYSCIGGHAQGVEWAAQFAGLIPDEPYLAETRQDVSANGNVHMINNPLFTNLAGGTTSGAGTIVNGVPLGYVANCDAGLTMTITSQAGPYGNDLILSMNAANAGLFRVAYDMAAEIQGATYEAGVQYDLAAGATNLEGFWCYMQSNYVANAQAVYDGYDTGYGALPATALTNQFLRTPTITIPTSGTRNWFTSYLQGRFSAAGSCAITLRRHTVRRVDGN